MDMDAAYDNGGHIPGAAAYPDRWAEDAAAWRSVEAALGRARLNLPYGSGARQRFDLFYPAGRPAGLAVFVHGGYWRRFDRADWSHFAAGCTGAGWACAVPSYTLAPEARIGAITAEIAAAVSTAAGLVAGPVVLAGHSAGGHLVARMAMADGPLAGDVAGRVTRVVPISPLADLRPLLRTSMNADLRLDEDEAAAESSVLGAKRDGVAVTVWVGADERPAFRDQARWLGEAWGVSVRQAAGRHHFDVIDALRDPDSAMVADLLDV
jgi:acetyl esterase/lipase